MSKVIYIVKSKLHFYPPCVTQIRLLKQLGLEIEVLFGSCSDTVTDIFEKEGIPYKKLCDKRDVFHGTLDKLNNYYCFRRTLIKELKNRDLENTLLWFGNAETLLSMKGTSFLKKNKYAITFLELLDDNPFRMRMLRPLAIRAKFNLACEETRAYLMKFWWGLEMLPYVMPNKPFDCPKKVLELTDENVIALLNEIGNKKIILYQGIIKEYDILRNFTTAIKELDDNYVLLLMGPDPENIFSKIKNITNKVIYSPYITAPNHLQVTSRAFAGIVFYNGDSTLNRAFCAPNKIYEYGAFGIPMIANAIPGLTKTVGACGAAVCTKLSVEDIVRSVRYIDSNYDRMTKASRDFYKSTDIFNIMKEIVKEQKL